MILYRYARVMCITKFDKFFVSIKHSILRHMLTDLGLDNRRGWVRGWVQFCICLMGNTLLISYRSICSEEA